MSDREKNGQFSVGNKAAVGHRGANAELKDAIKEAKASHEGVSLLESIIDRAYTSDTLAAVILKMLYPTLRQMDVQVEKDFAGFALLTPAEACAQMDKATTGENV